MESVEKERRDRWPPGQWCNEPDELTWFNPSAGFECALRRGPLGAWCGYVGLEEGHPLHGSNYKDLVRLAVHGGLTFGGLFEGSNLWYLGFDCAHANDLVPGMMQYQNLDKWLTHKNDMYRTIEYAVTEVNKLAHQLKEMT